MTSTMNYFTSNFLIQPTMKAYNSYTFIHERSEIVHKILM